MRLFAAASPSMHCFILSHFLNNLRRKGVDATLLDTLDGVLTFSLVLAIVGAIHALTALTEFAGRETLTVPVACTAHHKLRNDS
jgi:hypothetical protein